LHQAETGSRLNNGYCAMSFNSNLVVLNNMSNVIVDVGLPTSGRLMTLLSLSPADFKRILTVLVDRRSSIASRMAATITTGHPTSNWRDETHG
jgi:hypothetical protein